MGTRCDLYVGRGEQAEWLGSYPFDGYPDGMPRELLEAATEADFRAVVTAYLVDGAPKSTLPEHGWPWPWDDSRTTDYAYAFDDGKVWASGYGREWFDPMKEEPEDLPKTATFPDMSAKKATTLGPRSGMLVMAFPKRSK